MNQYIFILKLNTEWKWLIEERCKNKTRNQRKTNISIKSRRKLSTTFSKQWKNPITDHLYLQFFWYIVLSFFYDQPQSFRAEKKLKTASTTKKRRNFWMTSLCPPFFFAQKWVRGGATRCNCTDRKRVITFVK